MSHLAEIITITKISATLLLALISVYTDVRYGKVRNVICLIFALLGLILNGMLLHFNEIQSALLGLILPIILLYLLFKLKALGGGDIKLFAAIGAINGLNFIIYCLLYSFLFGGVIGLVLLAVRKCRHEKKVSKTHFIFSPAILLGTVYTYFFHILI